jgi:hypothetical protein
MYKFTVVVANKEDAEFMASSVRGVAATNNIKIEEAVELVELPEKILSDELRNKVLLDQAFLWDYAHTALCGDGMEYDTARKDLEGLDDQFIIESYLSSSRDNDDLFEELRKYPQFDIAFEDYDRDNRKEAE